MYEEEWESSIEKAKRRKKSDNQGAQLGKQSNLSNEAWSEIHDGSTRAVLLLLKKRGAITKKQKLLRVIVMITVPLLYTPRRIIQVTGYDPWFHKETTNVSGYGY